MWYDFSAYEMPADVYADGVGRIDNLGTNYRTVLYTYQMQGGVMTPAPILCIVRPKSSARAGLVCNWLKEHGCSDIHWPGVRLSA